MHRDEGFQLLSEYMSFQLALQQIGLPVPVSSPMDIKNQLDTYSHWVEFDNALREIVAECRQGNYSRADILGDLADTSHLGINLAELGCAYGEVRKWHRKGWVQRMRVSLNACREGQYQGMDPLVAEIEAVMMVQPWQPPISLEELGTNKEELERFRRMQSLSF